MSHMQYLQNCVFFCFYCTLQHILHTCCWRMLPLVPVPIQLPSSTLYSPVLMKAAFCNFTYPATWDHTLLPCCWRRQPSVPLPIQLPGSTLCNSVEVECCLLYLYLSNFLGAHSAALLLKKAAFCTCAYPTTWEHTLQPCCWRRRLPGPR